MKVINLFAGPGCGKSTTAAGAFYHLKLQQKVRVELATEYAKELCYRGVLDVFPPEAIVTEQYLRLKALVGQVDVAITDSPILLATVYTKDPLVKQLAWDYFNQFDNINLRLVRSKAYQPYGRLQTEAEAIAKDDEIMSLLVDREVDFRTVDYNAAVNTVLQIVEEIHAAPGPLQGIPALRP